MNYPYYYDQATGAPSGRFSAPMSRANIRNPITPYGIAYTPPEGATSEYAAPTQQQPSRLRRAANFLGRAALVGGALYAASQLGKGGDDGVTPVDVRVETPVRDRVQDLLKSVPSTGDVDVEGNPINPKQYDSAPRSSYYPSGRGAGGDYLKGVSTRDFKAAGDDPSAIAAISIADPEEVGGLRTKKSKDLLSKFRKNILTTEGRPQTEHPGLDEEIVGVSPEQAALGKTWTFVDNDRFFDHPRIDDPSVVNDEVPTVKKDDRGQTVAGQQHLDNYVERLVDAGVEHLENTTRYTAPASSSMMRGVEISPEFEVEVTTFPGKRQQKRAEAAQKAGIANMTDKYYYDQLQLRETDSREVQQEKVRKQVELMDAMKAGSEGSVSMGNRYNELLKKPYGGHVKGRYAEEGMVDAVYPQSPYPRDEF